MTGLIVVAIFAVIVAGLGWIAARLVPRRWPWLRAPVVIAATAVAAVAGYRSDDVPLAEWNAFQVGLTDPPRR